MSDIGNMDRWISVADRVHLEDAIATNDAFVAAMSNAIRKGKESVKLGTFVDLTPPISAIRLRGTVPMSHCGSPAQMCMENGASQGGAETMK